MHPARCFMQAQRICQDRAGAENSEYTSQSLMTLMAGSCGHLTMKSHTCPLWTAIYRLHGLDAAEALVLGTFK